MDEIISFSTKSDLLIVKMMVTFCEMRGFFVTP
jgi:hypothetical protein